MDMYSVRFLPSRKLMMIAPLTSIQVILGCHSDAIQRLETEDPCILHNTRLHGTVEVRYVSEDWQLLGEVQP